MKLIGSSLGDLPKLRNYKRRRISSYDKTGGNRDWWDFEPGDRKVIAEIKGAGCIKHIWTTLGFRGEAFTRKLLLRMFWDGEENPSVEVPLGDFFGVGHGIIKNFTSLPLTMSPSSGRGFNCFFPMPFSDGARIEVISECDSKGAIYFYIDYEEYDKLEEDLGRFHAQWRRQNPTEGWGENIPLTDNEAREKIWATPNLDGKNNYVILEAEGKGHYVGCNLNIDCFERQKNDWYGEGDDMIFIDGDDSLTIYGTGTEDYFNTAYSPREEFNAPYHGLTVYSGTEEWPWKGKNSVYRFHIEDLIYFDKSIKVTIEHGHANCLSNDYSSTAYWYQTEPHKKFPPMWPVKERLPRTDR